ncbi:MAG: double-strand break repair protein AddB, partial [Alphaproteobacteria bacterium]|nr:double-strand break repair protein AddB [Alphaproteobacteria bacterium]
MAEGAHNPHVFGLAPGVEFPRALVEGLIERYGQLPPHAFAKIEVLVNTRRMARRLKDIFAAGPARLLPRIRIVSDIGRVAVIPGLQPPVPSLRRRLELAQLVSRLLEAEPDLAPPTAAFDLADSLAALLDEMQGEDVPLEALNRIDVGDHSEHWARSLKFVSIVGEYLKSGEPSAPDPEQR